MKRTAYLLLLLLTLLVSACSGAGDILNSAATAAAEGAGVETTIVMPTALPTQTMPSTATTAPTEAVQPTSTAIAADTAAPTETPSPSATVTATPAPIPLTGESLVPALRGGGYIIYFRHAATDPQPDDIYPIDLTDCAKQRNLSAEGQAQARAIGEQFRRLEIPVGQLLSSPYCRAMDTVRLAFGTVTTEPVLENLESAADETERQARIDGLGRLLAAQPEAGTNTVLTGHGFNINAAASVTLPEGGAAVFRTDGQGGFELAATVRPEEWANFNPPP